MTGRFLVIIPRAVLQDGPRFAIILKNNCGKEGYAVGDGYFLLTNLLSEDEKKVITSITAHIERGEKRVGIQQIANENFLSTTTIVKMCKRLGFDGYSELYYYLSRQFDSHGQGRSAESLKSLLDNYSDALISDFCSLLDGSRTAKLLYRPAAVHLWLYGIQ